MRTLALSDSAALALNAGTRTVSIAVGAIVLVLAWGIHHRLSHRHRFLTAAAFLGMIAGATILFSSAGTTLLQWANGNTADWLAALADWAHLGGGWPHSIGLLTLIEVVLLIWTGSHAYDTFRGAQRAGRGTGTGTGSALAPASTGRFWQWLEQQFQRFGWFAVGPMTVTLPGAAGAIAAAPFAMLAGVVGHVVGAPFGV